MTVDWIPTHISWKHENSQCFTNRTTAGTPATFMLSFERNLCEF